MRNKLATRQLLLFMPEDEITCGAFNKKVATFGRNNQHEVYVDIYGTPGHSDLDGRMCIHDMKVMLGDKDIYDSLSDRLIVEWEQDIFESANWRDAPIKQER